MAARREEVSPETLTRAIKARLLLQHGGKSPLISLPLSIEQVDTDPTTGLNWAVSLNNDQWPPTTCGAVIEAAAEVALRMNYRRAA